MSGAFAPPSGTAIDLASPPIIGGTTPNVATFTSVTSTTGLRLRPSTTQSLTAASAILANGGVLAVTATAAITLTSNPQIAAGFNGQQITIFNVGTNAITLVNGNGLILPQATYAIAGGRCLKLIYLPVYSAWVLDHVII